MAQIQQVSPQGQQNQQAGLGQPNFNGQNVAVGAANAPRNDLMESVIFTAPVTFLDRMGGRLNSKKWYNDTATANYAKYEEGKKEKYLQAAFENWAISADQHASDAALNRLIALYKDGKIYLDKPGEGLSYQTSSPLELFRITVYSGTLPHWSALLEAFKSHWGSQAGFDRILLSQGAIMCRMLAEKAPVCPENALFLENLNQFGQLLNERLCKQPSYLYDSFLAKVYYEIEMAFEKKAFLNNLKDNAATHGQVYLNQLIANDAYLSQEVKAETLGNAGLYKEEYAQNALEALSNFVADRLKVEAKEDGVYINDKIFTLKEAQFLSHLALELKDMPKPGDIPLNQLASFLTEVKTVVTDDTFKKYLTSALNLLPLASPKSSAPWGVEQKVVQVTPKEAQERLIEAYDIFKSHQSTRGLNAYVPGSVELGRFLKKHGGKKVMQPGAEQDRKVLLEFMKSIKSNCFRKAVVQETKDETEARTVVETAIKNLSSK